jgi:hemerythrin superfamily protein
MNAIEFLQRQHREIDALFDELGHAETVAKKDSVLVRLVRAVYVHTALEEEVFYPALRRVALEPEPVLDAQEEHGVITQTARALLATHPSDPRFSPLSRVLSRLVVRHVEVEERELFALAVESLGKKALDRLGDELSSRSEELSDAPGLGRRVSRPTPVRRTRT